MSFHLAYSVLCCAKAFKFNPVPFVHFVFLRMLLFAVTSAWISLSMNMNMASLSFPSDSVIRNIVKNLPVMQETLV